MTLTNITALFASLLISSSVFANGHMMGGHHRGQNNHMMMQHLNLTSEQQTQMAAIKGVPSRPNKAQKMAQIALMSELIALDPKAADYQAKVDAIAAKRAAAVSEKAKQVVLQRAAFLSILTDDQKAIMQSRMERMSNPLNRGKGRHRPGHKCNHGQGKKKMCPHHKLKMSQPESAKPEVKE